MATLKEQIAAKNKRLQEMAAQVAVIEKKSEDGGIKSADIETMKTLMAEGKTLRAELDTLQEAQDFKAWSQGSAGSAVRSTEFTQEFTDQADRDQEEKAQAAAAKSAYRGAFEHYLRGGLLPQSSHPMTANDIKILRGGSVKALNEGTETAGGFSVPEDWQSEMLKKEPGLTALLDVVRRVPTSRDIIWWPIIRYTTDNKYTAPHRLTWTGETAASATTADVTDQTFGQVRIPVNVAMAGQKISNSLVEDSAVDIMGLTAELFRENVLQDAEYYLGNGTGSGQPEGLFVNSTAQTNYVAMLAAASITTANGIKDVFWGVPAQYRNRPTSRWIFSSATAQVISKLTDANGRYMWEMEDQFGGGLGSSQSDGPGANLLGRAVGFTEHAPSITTNSFPVAFGDMRGYIMPERVGMTVRVLNELYAETDQVKFLLRWRFGGQLAEDYRIKLGKVAAS